MSNRSSPIGLVRGDTLIRWSDRAVFVASLLSWAVVYVLDLIFWGSMASSWWLAIVFVLAGFVVRTLAIFTSILLSSVRDIDEARSQRAGLRVLWALCVIACIIPALSFFFSGHLSGERIADVADGRAAAVQTVTQQQIDQWEDDIAAREARLANTIEALRSTGDTIQDETAGVSTEDNITLRETNLAILDAERAAQADIAVIQLKIDGALTARQTESVAAQEARTEVSPFTALFVAVEQRISGVNADDSSFAVAMFFAFLIEAVAAFVMVLYSRLRPHLIAAVYNAQLGAQRHELQIAEIQRQIDRERMESDRLNRGLALSENEELQAASAAISALEAISKIGEGPTAKAAKEDKPEMTNRQRGGRAGGRANAAYQQAKKNKRIEIDDRSVRDRIVSIGGAVHG